MSALDVEGPVVVVGAGLAGSLLAIYLAHHDVDVVVYESRPDLRTVNIESGRSINLALATRGIVPLIDVGVIASVDAITIPMRGRMIHSKEAAPSLQPYGTKPHEVIHSVARNELNALLLDAAEATGRVEVRFEARLRDIDFDAKQMHFTDGTTESFGVIFGCDGAGSRVRRALVDVGACTAHTDWLDHEYKELTLAPTSDGAYQIDEHALHIWPRGDFMLIALPNPEGDFTMTLFAPKATFDGITSPAETRAFFDTEFPGMTELLPDLPEQFFDNPRGLLGTLRATGWSLDDSAVIVGDAAHAIVPFHGQGMNAALESVRELDHQLRTHDSLADAFRAYEAARKPNADAIADLALDNYIEMRKSVTEPDYLAKRALALELEHRHPDHLSPRYNMVMFSTMPYAEAKDRAERQASLIAAALADPNLDVAALVEALPPLPDLDPLADPYALGVK